jgi:hypothetical protein
MRKAEEVAAGAHPAGGLAAINPAELFQVLLNFPKLKRLVHVAQHWPRSPGVCFCFSRAWLWQASDSKCCQPKC